MRFDTKALLKLMKQSWRGGGVKIQRTEYRGLWDSFFITGAGWALLIPKENCPGEIAGQIVTWLADMPKIGESKWVVKGCDPQDIPEDDRTIDISRYTTGNYETGIACWKDEDTHGLFWLCDNAGNVPQDVLDAVKHFTPQKH